MDLKIFLSNSPQRLEKWLGRFAVIWDARAHCQNSFSRNAFQFLFIFVFKIEFMQLEFFLILEFSATNF